MFLLPILKSNDLITNDRLRIKKKFKTSYFYFLKKYETQKCYKKSKKSTKYI